MSGKSVPIPARPERAVGYIKHLCSLVDKIHHGEVREFGCDPFSLEDVADLLHGMGHEALSKQLGWAAKRNRASVLLSIRICEDGCADVRREL